MTEPRPRRKSIKRLLHDRGIRAFKAAKRAERMRQGVRHRDQPRDPDEGKGGKDPK